MKRYRFRLEQVQRVRNVQEGLAAAHLAVARTVEARAVACAEARVDAIAARPRPSGSTSASALTAARLLWDAELRSLADARQAVSSAAEASHEARTAWSNARARVRALELLDDRHRADHAVAADRDEASRVDDLVVSRAARTHPRPGAER